MENVLEEAVNRLDLSAQQPREPMETEEVSDWQKLMEQILQTCDGALVEQFRNISQSKREYILLAVQQSIDTAVNRIRETIDEGNQCKELLQALGLSINELTDLLPQMVDHSFQIQQVAESLGCEAGEIVNLVEIKNAEIAALKLKLKEFQTAEQPREVMQPQQAEVGETPPVAGKFTSETWKQVREKVQTFMAGNACIPLQPRVCRDSTASRKRTDGRQSPHQRTWQTRSQISSIRSYPSRPPGQSSQSSYYSDSGAADTPRSLTSVGTSRNTSSNVILNTLKEVLKSQSVAEVRNYNGKNSLTDFLRTIEIKYPQSVWSNKDRRDILINHLEGTAKAHVENMPAELRNGTFEDIVAELRKARETPGERLKARSEWKHLCIRDHETVFDFCCRMKRIATRMQPDQTMDFELGSKLYECLSDWPDSYHLLAALDAPEGRVFDQVKKVALRLERTREASKLQRSKEWKRQDSRTTSWQQRDPRTEEQLHDEQGSRKRSQTSRTCYECGEGGHFASKCPKRLGKNRASNRKLPRNSTTVGVKEPQQTSREKRSNRVSFTDHLCSWYINAKTSELEKPSAAYGKPCHCPVHIFGMKAKALIDTGSVISIVPVGLLKQAQRKGADLNEMVTMMDSDDNQIQVYDASGNPMTFLMRIAANIRVHGAGKAKIQLHIQKSNSQVILLGTNALAPLGIELKLNPERSLKLNDMDRNASRNQVCDQHTQHGDNATAMQRVLIPPFGTAELELSSHQLEGDRVFWTHENRIASGVCRISKGSTKISVINNGNEPWLVRKGQVMGTWTNDRWYDPKTTDIPGDMLEMRRTKPTPYKQKAKQVLKILLNNKKSREFPLQLKELITKYADTFAVSDVELTQTHLIEHDIDVQGHSPIRQKTRPVPYALRREVKDMLQDLEERHIIEESTSPWASPIVLVAKKDGGIRLCVDYREVNKLTKKECYPLPAIDVTLQNLRGKRYFTSLDLASGYWQVPLTKQAKEISAFTTTAGHYQFRVIPFGLTNAPAAFQRLMEKVLATLLGPEVSVYIDDILIATETIERHYQVLEDVLLAIQGANLKIKPQKCKMLETQVAFLGHVVDKEGVRMDPDKVNNIHQYPRPNNLPELRTFLGMTGYYRKFILRYAQTAKPLYDLTCTKVKFEWNSQHDRAFITLKELLTHAPVLAQPDIEKARNGSRPFIIYTDASKVGIGAVLAQEQDDGFLHPLYFASKPLSRAEQNYHVTDQEGLAVVYALKKFHYFIYGIPTILRTDHATLTSLFKRTNVSSRVLRWALEVQRYDLTIQHVKGSANSVADALSRGIASADQDSSTPTLEENEKVVCLITETWMDELREDDDFTSVIEAVESGKETEVRLPRHERKLNTKDFVIHNNQLKLIAEDGSLLLVVPRSKRREIFDEGHHGKMGGHFNARKMFAQLRKAMFWPGMKQDLQKWCKQCQKCFLTNAKPINVPPLKPRFVPRPFQVIGVDLLEMGLTSRGNKYIVTVIDHFSKYLGAYPVPDKQADTIAEAIFSHWICDGGRWPECILSDRGGEFENAVVAALCEILQIKQEFTKGYCPRENGLTERVNGTIARMLKKKTLIPTDWDRMLPAVVYAYNASPHSATSESPHFLVYGHDPKYPPTVIPREYLSPYMIDYDEYKTQFFNSLKLARDCITEHAEKYRNTMKHQYDKRWRTKKSQVFSPGDRVYMKVPAEKGKSHHPKLTVDWRGPYRVLEASSNSALITLIGANEEPVRIQFDHLVKVPPDIDDTPIKGRTLRGRRGRPKKLEKGRTASQVSSIRISRPALKLACNMIIFRGRRSSRTDPATVDFRCPGTYEHVGQKLICKQPGPLRDVVPNAPLPYLVLRSPFELGRAVTILQQTHLPETAVRDLLLDTTYITLSPTALSVAYSYLRKGCMHIGTYLRHVHQIGSIKHPPRHRDDPFDIDNIVRRATTSMPILTAWTAEAWGTLTEKKVIVLLPHGFSDYTRGFSFKTQRAYSYLTPRDIQEDWLEGELSAIVLFSSMTNDTVDDWIEPWCHIVTAIANGADLFCVPGPRDDGNWGFGVDLLRDLCEETVSQRPSLKTRIHILLPLSSEEGDSTPFNILGVRRTNAPRFYTPSCAKRFLNATVRYYALRIKLYPFIRTDRDQHPPNVPGNCRNDTSGNSPSTSTDGPHGHHRERTPFNSRGTWYRSRGGFAYREERDRNRYIERREERVRARNDDIERRRSSYREVGEDGTWVPRKHHAGVSHPF